MQSPVSPYGNCINISSRIDLNEEGYRASFVMKCNIVWNALWPSGALSVWSCPSFFWGRGWMT